MRGEGACYLWSQERRVSSLTVLCQMNVLVKLKLEIKSVTASNFVVKIAAAS